MLPAKYVTCMLPLIEKYIYVHNIHFNNFNKLFLLLKCQTCNDEYMHILDINVVCHPSELILIKILWKQKCVEKHILLRVISNQSDTRNCRTRKSIINSHFTVVPQQRDDISTFHQREHSKNSSNLRIIANTEIEWQYYINIDKNTIS